MPRAVVSPASGAGSPVADCPPSSATGCFTDAIAMLRLDLEKYRHRVVEVELLITRLSSYVASGTVPGQSVPVAAKPKNRGGRPVLDVTDTVRAAKASAMRERRSRVKAEAKTSDLKKKPNGGAAASPRNPMKNRSPNADVVFQPIKPTVDATAVDQPSPLVRPPDEPPMAEPLSTADGLRARLARAVTLEKVIEVVVGAAELASAAAAAKDLPGFRTARIIKLEAERAGGAILLRTPLAPVSKLKIGNVAGRWRDLAGASDDEFERRILALRKSTAYPAVLLPHRKAGPKPVPGVTQRLTKWETDEDGNRCRSLVTEGETPLLEGERR
jgi:hypothetical protein